MSKKAPYQLGLVLSGGGIRGFAHIGILQALEERGIKPDIIAGASAGAIVGAFYADGKSPSQIRELLKDKNFFNYSRLQLPQNGLLKLTGLKRQLQEDLEVDNLEELKVPLFVSVTNISQAKVEYLNKGSIADVILASASIPILFSPVKIDGQFYADGGLYDNLPVKPLQGLCRRIIAVNVTPLSQEVKLKNMIQVSSRIVELTLNANMEASKAAADFLLEPPSVEEFNILDIKNRDKIYQLGYDYAKKLKINI